MDDNNVSNEQGDNPDTPKKKVSIKKPNMPKIKKNQIIGALVIAVLLIAAGIGYQKYQTLQRENKRLSNPQAAAQAETDKLKADVAKLIQVPANEQPTIATVVDASKLKNQPFFKNAQNGDKVLIFAQAKKAILYRPSTNKIIEVAPINIGKSTKQTTQPATQTQTQQTPTRTY